MRSDHTDWLICFKYIKLTEVEKSELALQDLTALKSKQRFFFKDAPPPTCLSWCFNGSAVLMYNIDKKWHRDGDGLLSENSQLNEELN